MYPRQARDQRRKFLRFHPEREMVEHRQIKPGYETNEIRAVESEISGNRVTKVFRDCSPDDERWGRTPHAPKARYKFQKELWSKGFPVPKPIGFSMEKTGKDTWDITWVEQFISGPNLRSTINMRYLESVKANKPLEPIAEEERQIYNEAMNQLQGLMDYLASRGIKASSADVVPPNIVKDKKTGKFYLIDIQDYPRVRKPPKKPRP
jgi:hypothetical protein